MGARGVSVLAMVRKLESGSRPCGESYAEKRFRMAPFAQEKPSVCNCDVFVASSMRWFFFCRSVCRRKEQRRCLIALKGHRNGNRICALNSSVLTDSLSKAMLAS